MPLVGINSWYVTKYTFFLMAPRSVHANDSVNYHLKEGEARVKAVIFRIVVVFWWSEFLGTDTEVPGSIPGATVFCE